MAVRGALRKPQPIGLFARQAVWAINSPALPSPARMIERAVTVAGMELKDFWRD
jgi:hypothetical protein